MNNTAALGTQKIETLFRKMAVPAVTAQVISFLYNIVDRIYIGHMSENGAAALTAIGLLVPITSLVHSFAMLIGAGGSPLLSIELGRGDKDRAEKILGTCVSSLLVLSAALSAMLFLAAPFLIRFLGASDSSFPYAYRYARIYIPGIPFVMLTSGLNLFISGQGFSRISMLTTVIGAVINIILDPVLIFGLHMGVEGAAIATILAQAVSSVWIVSFLCGRKATVRIRKMHLRIHGKILLSCISLGISSFVMFSTEGLLSATFIRSLAVYGGDIAVGTMTIISSVATILHYPATGLTHGSNPIISYNFGSRQNDRVRRAFSVLLRTSVIYSAAVWFVVLFFPQMVAGLFTTDKAMALYCSKYMRIYFAVAVTNAFQTSCQQSFIALGQAKTALFMAVLRKLILLIPLILLLPRVFEGDPIALVFLAEPVSDIIAAAACSVTFFSRLGRTLEKGPRLQPDKAVPQIPGGMAASQPADPRSVQAASFERIPVHSSFRKAVCFRPRTHSFPGFR